MKASLGLKCMVMFLCEILTSVHIHKLISNWEMRVASVQVDPACKHSGLQRRAMTEHECMQKHDIWHWDLVMLGLQSAVQFKVLNDWLRSNALHMTLEFFHWETSLHEHGFVHGDVIMFTPKMRQNQLFVWKSWSQSSESTEGRFLSSLAQTHQHFYRSAATWPHTRHMWFTVCCCCWHVHSQQIKPQVQTTA